MSMRLTGQTVSSISQFEMTDANVVAIQTVPVETKYISSNNVDIHMENYKPDLKKKPYLIYARISNPLKHFSIHIFLMPPTRYQKKTLPRALFEEMIKNFEKHLQKRGYPDRFIQNTLSEVNFEDRKLALQKK